MGYDIYITRRVHWSDNGEPQITPDEWLAVIESDPQLIKLVGRNEEEPVAQMLSPDGMAARFFRYLDGHVFVKKPTKEVLLQMIALAKILNARVIGEQDEIYLDDGTPDSETSYFAHDWDYLSSHTSLYDPR